MADFCKQASIELFGKDYGDFKGLCKSDEIVDVLCEDCGSSTVNAEGYCIGGQLCKHEACRYCQGPLNSEDENLYGLCSAACAKYEDRMRNKCVNP
jgi:hypothetical protein